MLNNKEANTSTHMCDAFESRASAARETCRLLDAVPRALSTVGEERL